MDKTKIITVVVAAAIMAAATIYSCNKESKILPINEVNVDGYHTLKVIPFEGHDYLLLRRINHGSTMIHSESCKCKTTK